VPLLDRVQVFLAADGHEVGAVEADGARGVEVSSRARAQDVVQLIHQEDPAVVGENEVEQVARVAAAVRLELGMQFEQERQL
jgi:hypothetical protein